MDTSLLSLSISFFLIWAAASSCTVTEIGIERTPTPNLQLTAVSGTLAAENAKLATRIAEPVLSSSGNLAPLNSSPTTVPSPTLPPPSFSSVRFSPQPDDALARDYYVAGTPRIFAMWDYTGMQEGMLVKRVWKWNDEIWIEREEPWAFNPYSEQGTVKNIYIFDDDIGVAQGKYSLTLYIDGILQDLNPVDGFQSEAVFHVFESEVPFPVTSPDKSHTAFVQFGGRLMIEEPDGRVLEMAEVQEISSISWFPDGNYLLYTERDRTKQNSSDEDAGITHRLYILDINTGEQTIVGTSGENYHQPLISPGGEFISVLSGNTLREDCTGSPTLAIIELDAELRRQAIHSLASFTGFEFLYQNSSSVIPRQGEQSLSWDSDTRLSVDLEWVCPPSGINRSGTYVLDLSQMTAEPKNQP